MFVVSGAQTGLPENLYAKVARYRYEIFIERLGWQLETRDGAELDQFDRPDTVYVVAQDNEERILGCARLLPTTRPYLVGEVFPQLLNGLTPPCSPEVWELSRFAAVDLSSPNSSFKGQFSSPVAVSLLRESIACAATRGAKRLITASPIGVERLLRRAGFHARRAGPPVLIEGEPLFACIIDIEPTLNQ